MVSFTLRCCKEASRSNIVLSDHNQEDSLSLLPHNQPLFELCTSVQQYSKNFIDKVRIFVSGGSGGNGLPTLGGKGGRGGKVFIVGSQDAEYTLKDFKNRFPLKRFKADPGDHSNRRCLSGMDGASIYIQVPYGITVVDVETKRKLGDISCADDKVLVARGGVGGMRATQFVPRKGQKRSLFLDLKLIADVGFVGFPNAGKSTLLRRLSKARPEVAEYAFTTIKPELGVMEYPDFRKIQLADLPGIIEGAHENKGRGHVFLKHIERTHLLLFVIDVTGFRLDAHSEFRDAFESLQLLTKELELYDPKLIRRPALLALNKMDKRKSHFYFDELKKKLENWKDHLGNIPKDMIPKEQANIKEIIPISALEDRSTAKLKKRIREVIDDMVISDNMQLKIDHDEEFEALNSPPSEERKVLL